MGDITYTRTGNIKEIAQKAILLEMSDTGENVVWPLVETEEEESDISGTLSVGEKVDIELHISDDPSLSNKNDPEDNEEAEKLRKMLEELLN
jgi:hypothetical protein